MAAEAVVKIKPSEGAWEPLTPVWSLTVESDDHGPAQATFVCKRRLTKYTEAEILIDGLPVGDGWVEDCESEEGLHNVTVFMWQRALDDDLYIRTYMMSGFEQAVDARDGPGVNQAYWARAGLNLAEKSLTMALQPNTIWYMGQAGGVTYDLGEGGVGPLTVWLHQEVVFFPAGSKMYLYVRAHSTRANHHPFIAGQYQDATGSNVSVSGLGGAAWRGPFEFTANALRYLSIFLYSPTFTYDLAKDSPEYYLKFDETRISTLGAGGGHAFSLNGSTMTADQAVPNIVAQAPALTVGRNDLSAIPIFGLATDGYQSPRQMLERINLDQWRYRVNPGRRLDRTPYPTSPTFTIREPAIPRLRIPDTRNRIIVQYRDEQGDDRQLVQSVTAARQRSDVITLGGTAALAQATPVAEAFLRDQAERRVEGSVRVPVGALTARPSGEPLHPSRLLLAGGDRAWIDDCEDHGRMVKCVYTHDDETCEVDFAEASDDLEEEMALLEQEPTG